MKQTLLTYALCICACTCAAAQEKAQVAVGYDYHRTDKRGAPRTTRMTLLASAGESKYFNDISLWSDSLSSTPDGKAKLREIIMKTAVTRTPDGGMKIDMSKGPLKTEYLYVFTRPADGTLTVFDKWGMDQGHYTEPLAEQTWTIVEDSTASVLGYECIMAETDYHGRHWRAWFAPEVPLPFGPWKLHGLPGLILRAEADGGFSFEATGIANTDRRITPMYDAGAYPRTDRLKALENREYMQNNSESMLKAMYGSTVKTMKVDAEGNEVAPARYDGRLHALEPDYKK